MDVKTLIADMGLELVSGDGATLVGDLTDDSRRVTPGTPRSPASPGSPGAGTLFIARGGSVEDGRQYIADAIARGAVAVVTHDDAPSRPGVAWIRPAPGVNVDQTLAGRLAERFFGEPSRHLKLIAITGTNGKTTTAFLIQHLLNQAGVKCGLMGTVIIDDGQERRSAELTTPGAIDFSRHLAAMVAHGCKAAVTEVSSHALHQGRVSTLRFDVGVFTNLTGDHLDYHKTMEDYAAAKAILFDALPAAPEGFAVMNMDDPWAGRMMEGCRARVLACTLLGAEAEEDAGDRCRATVLHLAADHSRVRFDGPWGSVEVDLPLVGRHNVINALQAIAAANAVTAIARGLRKALEQCPSVPGRLEPVRISDLQDKTDLNRASDKSEIRNPKSAIPTVIVDYAHTHDALENVLLALRPVTRGRLIVLFGCGGDRDRTKRPKMAAVACRLADRVIITSDNPRTEDPAAIIREILAGVPQGMAISNFEFRIADLNTQGPTADAGAMVMKSEIRNPTASTAQAKSEMVLVEPDRARAIQRAIMDAQPDDVVLLAGKGHEDYQIIGREKHHFDDREQAAAVMKRFLLSNC
ncbi:MAG: UDP-N-acetylmuramoyl-L-alanyl-D-glutamate--2,6-diaminopimelate ligase [Phycisphaeraceae bacterium]